MAKILEKPTNENAGKRAGRGLCVRGVEAENGMWYLSVYDFIKLVTAHEHGDKYAQKVSLASSHLALSTNKKLRQIAIVSKFKVPGGLRRRA